ncbi:tetratricopeptide repeat protein [Polyangium sp. 15x6]|uniref:tetratricopeptide repeat protein n=1 Tax=Polyangium sp. 15x6 TaxID=3042687 RepID=UPI00249C5016|nr:tetratricopeptide repeat protein [Polyangium sp. 15x6]MDI3287009.1 tetratricopeptide repeat protein [Polyangium sp. 15x6]
MKQLGVRAVILAGSTLIASACDRPSDAPKPTAAAAPAQHDPLGPPSQAEMPTTHGIIATTNLIGHIEALTRNLESHPGDLESKRQLIELLAARGQYLGRIADAERAAAMAEELVRDAPTRPWAYAARAHTRAAMHRFTEALADLAEAEKRGEPPANLIAQKAMILEGQGDLDGALALRRKMRELNPNLNALGLEGALVGQMGRTDEAVGLFRRAAAEYRDVSPFPVAWLFLQQGLLWERAGNVARAKTFYAAAHERLPGYVHAAAHLATLEQPAVGIELLKSIADASDDPEFEHILVNRLRAHGDVADADARAAHVRARYAELVDKHPEAYAEHAGWFLLDEGKEPQNALAFAKTNLAVRRTEKAYQLAMLAAFAAGARAEACTFGQDGAKLPYASGMLRAIAADACKPAAVP